MSSQSLPDRYDQAHQALQAADQSHLLTFYDRLPEDGRARLLDQVEAHDWTYLAELIETHVTSAPGMALAGGITPAPCYPARPDSEQRDKYDAARALGCEMIGDGRIAAFTVAGGQGSRLGWDGPKGCYPATPIGRKSLFEVFAQYLLKIQEKYRSRIHWYVMTSPINDQATRDFFSTHNHFGLEPKQVQFFPQGTLPSFSLDGRALLAAPDELAVNPDGHGGSLRALFTSGALDEMSGLGIDQISYFQVDNPAVRCIDPLFVGLHALDQAQMSSKMIPKATAEEKVGVFVEQEGHIAVIEYSDLPDDLARETDGQGQLRFNAGSIAIHMIEVDFVRQLNQGRFALPPHRAVKKVPHVDLETGERAEPKQANAVKLETFVFDALPLCRTSIVLETERAEEFAPIKNADGADSPETSCRIQIERAARWLESRGVQIPRRPDGETDARIEISPLTAIEPTDLEQIVDLPAAVEPAQTLLI
ncbi:MAG: UDPGP type 1 family protein [Phycisphaerae bacterium]|nr:UDPGP type 1 family protein [Phycisphaerae bacterium]